MLILTFTLVIIIDNNNRSFYYLSDKDLHNLLFTGKKLSICLHIVKLPLISQLNSTQFNSALTISEMSEEIVPIFAMHPPTHHHHHPPPP